MKHRSQEELFEYMKENKNHYNIFLPKRMWGDIFYEIWGEDIKFPVEPYELGEKSFKSPEAITEEIIKKVEKKKNITPIIIMPITLFPIFNKRLNPALHLKNGLKMLGPAFKTRDDIYITMYNKNIRRKCKKNDLLSSDVEIFKDSHNIKLASKGDELTTTALGNIFASNVMNKVSDPLLDLHWIEYCKNKPWNIDLNFEHPPPNHDGFDAVKKLGWDGMISTGAEDIGKVFKDMDWTIAVNLNSWICRRLGVRYFIRSVFCSLDECFRGQYHLERLNNFWLSFVIKGQEWVKKVQQKCNSAHTQCFAGKGLYPIQAPSVMKRGKTAFQEFAKDISAMKMFLTYVKNINSPGYGAIKDPLNNAEIHCVSPLVKFEELRITNINILINQIIKKTIEPVYQGDTYGKTYNSAFRRVFENPVISIEDAFFEDIGIEKLKSTILIRLIKQLKERNKLEDIKRINNKKDVFIQFFDKLIRNLK